MPPSSDSTGSSGPKPRRLGRGLSSLLDSGGPVRVQPRGGEHSSSPPTGASPVGDVEQRTTPSEAGVAGDASHRNVEQTPTDHTFLWLSPEQLVPNRFQPREHFDEAHLTTLADSIRQSGVMQPLVVRRPIGQDGTYELVAGERRWRAAKQAGVDRLPVIVRDIDDETSATLALVENMQREDLNPMERARGLRSLIDRFGLTQREAAERVGVERSSAANLIRLTELEPEIQELIERGALGAGHGKALLSAPAGAGRVTLAMRAVEESWTVRATERACGETVAAVHTPTQTHPEMNNISSSNDGAGVRASFEDLEKRLGEHLGTRVKLMPGTRGTRGRVVIEYYDLDHFDGLLAAMGYQHS